MSVQPENEPAGGEPAGHSMRVASRLTGVTPERLRAWESRHGAIRPDRTAGGTRRYSDADLARLTLLRQVVDTGHRISDVAHLDADALRALLPATETDGELEALFPALDAVVESLDAAGFRALLERRCERLGLIDFARDEALRIAARIGDRWESGEISVAAEHLATAVLRSMLVGALRRERGDGYGPRIVFATPNGERHDLGLLVTALIAQGHGAEPIFVGADVPVDELVGCVRSTRADVLALGFVVSPPELVETTLTRVRGGLPDATALWVGGRGIAGCAPIAGVDRIETHDRLDAFVLEARGRGADASGLASGRASGMDRSAR